MYIYIYVYNLCLCNQGFVKLSSIHFIYVYIYIFNLCLYNKGFVRLESSIHFITPLCCSHYVDTCPVECHMFCSDHFSRILHLLCRSSLTFSDVAYKMCNNLSSPPPLSLKKSLSVCPLFKAQRTQYRPPVTVPTICGLCFA